MNTHIDTTDMVRVERPLPSVAPPPDTPVRSPFFVSQVPTTAIVNPDAIRNFHAPQIPSYRITPPLPLTLSGAGANAVPTTSGPSARVPQPPAPTIAQALTSIAAGYTFSFNEVRLPLSSDFTISTYKVYRGSSNNSALATVIDTIPHNPTQLSTPVVVQDNVANGVTQFYFVSAINSRGSESTLTPAQSVAVTNHAGFDINAQLAPFHNQAVDSSFAPTSSTTLSNNGIATAVTISASSIVFGAGIVSYNSGSVDLGTTGETFVYADDVSFQGGAVVYGVTNSSPFTQVGTLSRLPFGKIMTVLGSTKTGGGFSGGSTGTGAGGGRGYVQQ